MDWAAEVNRIASGYQDSIAMLSAVKAGLFEALGNEWKTAPEAARDAGLDPRATGVVLCALKAAGLLRQEGRRFSIEPEAATYLLSGSPRTQVSIMNHNLSMAQSWVQLVDVLRSGKPVRGQDRSEDELRDFILGMENISRTSSEEAAGKIDWNGVHRLLDLGGGPGTAALAFARAIADLECVVFDLPDPLKIAREQIARSGLEDRVSTHQGDFLQDSLPGDFDLVYISNIIHMLGPDDTLELFRKSRAALTENGRIVVKDFTVDESLSEPPAPARFSVHMLVSTENGKTYAQSELVDLLRKAGFVDLEIQKVASVSQLIVGKVES